MRKGIVRLTEETVTLCTDAPVEIGIRVNFEVTLPEGVLLRSFTLNGTVTDCEYVDENNSGGYMLEMKIGDVSPMNKKILAAYIDFLERDKMLKEITIDLKAFEDAFDEFERRLKQLEVTKEVMKANVNGTLELLNKNAAGTTTIH